MKEFLYNSFNQRLELSHRNPVLSPPLVLKEPNFYSKEEILFTHKSSLESLLNIIKNFQLKYFSKKNTKNKLKTKEMILCLKDNLNLILKEKNKKYNYLKSEKEKRKKKIQKIIYPSSRDSFSAIREYNITLGDNKIYNNFTETNQLKLLNFQMENELQKTIFLIQQKKQINSYIKTMPFFYESNQEIFCYNNYDNYKKISDLLKEIIKKTRQDFINVVKQKMKKNIEINAISTKINYIKDNIEDYDLEGCKKYIDTDEIIQEESKEYNISNNQSKRNSLINIINKSIVKKMSSINSRGSVNKHKTKERKIKDKYQKRNSFVISNINKDLLNDINNNQKVNNYVNMNINVNINLNNNVILQSFNSSLDSDEIDGSDEKSPQYEMDLNPNSKIVIKPIITHEDKNTKNNDNDDTNNYNCEGGDNEEDNDSGDDNETSENDDYVLGFKNEEKKNNDIQSNDSSYMAEKE